MIFAKEHWMDVVGGDGFTGHERVMLRLETQKAPQQAIDVHLAKYAARYQKGDIVEVQPDGFRKNFNKAAFEIVNVPGEPVDPSLMEPQIDGQTFKKRRRYNIKAADVALGGERVTTKAALEINDKQAVAVVDR